MRGFTLIEVIVTVGISLLVTGVIIVNYNSYNDVQLLKQSALTLKNNMRFAQTKASSGEKPTPVPSGGPPICTQLVGYIISFTASTYSVQASCEPEGPLGDIIAVTLPYGVTFSPIPSAITFNVLTHGTSLDSISDMTLTGFGKQYSIQVSPSGNVSDLGLQ